MVDHQRPIPPDAPEQYTVVLPVPPDTFRQFVSGLLGKPQTITKVFRDCFEVRTQDIENTFHLVDQRVRQQNEASLIQFIVRITYDDGSSVLLNTLEDFLHYKEIHPLVSTGVVLSWTYLIRFPEKTVPEKQEIEVTMLADPRQGEARVLHLEELRFFPPSLYFGGQIDIRIAHTARTWGADIEALLTGHIK